MMASIFLNGCGQSDTDITNSPEYNFSSFSGTLCETRVKVALADAKRYNGAHEATLFPAEMFDKKNPNYVPVHDMQVITVLPVGTLLRIGRLMKDNGDWGGVEVTATVESGEYAKKTVYLDQRLFAKNVFIWTGWSNSRNWGVNPDVLEVVTNAL
jgi:hypothetical protein